MANLLTQRQKTVIDRLMEKHPDISPESVNGFYQGSYARSWYIYIEFESSNEYGSWQSREVITRCDWKHTARAKVLLIREYISAKSTAEGLVK